MWAQSLTIGMSLMAGVTGAVAQTAAQTTFATVDASGRILPSVGSAPSIDGLPGEGHAAAPCAPSVDIPFEAARALIVRIATEEKFHPGFVVSVAKIESHHRSTALSEKGAYGLMQLMPVTAKRFGVDLCDPEGNVRGGVRYLRELHERYQNPLFVLVAYNAGEGALRKHRGVPPYPETVRYVADVMNDFYAWPNPAEAAKGAEQAAAIGPDFIEPLSAEKPLATTSASARPNDGTAASVGFVMHFE